MQVWNKQSGEQVKFSNEPDGIPVYCSQSFPSEDRVLVIAPSVDSAHTGKEEA